MSEGKSSSAGGTPSFSGREKEKDIRYSNIVGARACAECVRTSLGPKGMDKMIVGANNEVIITNDGATILKKMEVQHPAAKMMVDLSQSQDVEAGDGTTTVVVLAGALLGAAQSLLEKGVHPSRISQAFLEAAKEAMQILRDVAVPLSLTDRDSLCEAAITSLNSKVISQNSATLAPLAVDAVLKVIPDLNATNVDLGDIKIVKRLGGTVEDTELVDGLVFDNSASHAAGGPTHIQNAKIGLIQFCLSAPKTNMENSVVIEDYQQIDRILREERKYILNLLKPIIKSGCNVLLIQKSILRDAVNDLSLHYLAKKGIMVVKDIERTDIQFISTTLGCIPIADPEQFTADKLGHAEVASEVPTASGNIVKITGVKNPGKTVSILVRGSNRLMMDEAERSLHDALCVIRSLVKERYMIAGGSAPEMRLSLLLAALADKTGGLTGFCMKEYARAFEVIPYTLAENAGLSPIAIVTELRNLHATQNQGTATYGINIKQGKVSDMLAEKVVQPLLVTTSAINLATETVRMILKIDDIVAVR